MKKIFSVYLILIILCLSSFSGSFVNAGWDISDPSSDVGYYYDDLLISTGSNHSEIDIYSFELVDSNIEVSFMDEPVANESYCYYVAVTWVNVTMCPTKTVGFLGATNFITTEVYNSNGKLIDELTLNDEISISGYIITYPIPLFSEITNTTPYCTCVEAFYMCNITLGEYFMDYANQTFIKEALVAPGFLVGIALTSLTFIGIITIVRKRRNSK
ncbi:MAG: hypothetical protein FK734_03370 [Asgard group archaeon]|nr:hypothetical protein [Asgard group archaeon]